MEQLTTNDENHILASLNLFYCKDNEVWIRGGGPEPDYADCTLVDWIVSAAEKHHLDIFSRDAEGLGEEMYDSMQFGSDTIEGIVALLHAAAIQAAEMRAHLAAIEDILGDEYDLDRLRLLLENDKSCYTCKKYKGGKICGFKRLNVEINPQEGCSVREAALRREQDGNTE